MHEGQGLIGRREALGRIELFLDRMFDRGAALVVLGDPGSGKTALLDAAEEAAMARGGRVLRAAGVEFEIEVSFSGLNQALTGLEGSYEELDPAYREALMVALGLGTGSPPDRLLLTNAVLALLTQAVRQGPLLLIVDDVHWLDRASADVLGAVARRLEAAGVGFLSACRLGSGSFFEQAGLPDLELLPLDDERATELLRSRFPAMASSVRRRVLADAEGNPLALVELPSALTGEQLAAVRSLPAVLPLTRRLEGIFAARVRELPQKTRKVLLAAVLEGTGDLGPIRAGGFAGPDFEELAPAEEAGLVVYDSRRRLRFHHPLVRAVVVDLSTEDEKRGVHRALAELISGQDLERRAWHLAQATVDRDQEVSGLLEQAAHSNLRRGDAVGAVRALVRAADLHPSDRNRARLLAEAAYIGADVTGDLREVARLLEDAQRADPGADSLEAAVAGAFLLLNGDGDVDAAHHLLVEAIDRQRERHESSAEALHTLMTVCWFGGGRDDLWQPFEAGLAELGASAPEALALSATTLADPARATETQLGQLDRAIGKIQAEKDPVRIVRLGMASFFVDRMSGLREAHWRVVEDGRNDGAVTAAIDALIHLCLDDYMTGQWDEAQRLADEGVQLCNEHGYLLLSWPERYCQALLAASRGDAKTTRALADTMTEWATPRGVRVVRQYAWHARALAELGQGNYEGAYQQVSSISRPGTLPSHLPLALWTALDLVDAAVHSGRRSEAAAHAACMEAEGLPSISPRLALLTAAAFAIAAEDSDAKDLFEFALALPEIERWPFDFARVQLAYGEHLRRSRAISESRSHLTAALEIFQRLGALPWAKRAGKELRATGQARPRLDPTEAARLTSQEREIAELAASGLTNRQIGERLYLSHRTIAAHLYRVFPKLGITSRAALRDALTEVDPVDAR